MSINDWLSQRFKVPPAHSMPHQYENSDGVSDFAPICKCDSTPDRDPPTNRYLRYHSKRHSPHSQSPRLLCSRLSKKGLGDKNILNMAQVSVQQAKVRLWNYGYSIVDKWLGLPGCLTKARIGISAHLQPSKKCRLFHKDDKDWLECKIDDVRDLMMQIADHLRKDLDSKLDKILHEVSQI